MNGFDDNLNYVDSMLIDNFKLTNGEGILLIIQDDIDDCIEYFFKSSEVNNFNLEIRKVPNSAFYDGNYPNEIYLELNQNYHFSLIFLIVEWSKETTKGRLKFLKKLADLNNNWRVVSMPGMKTEYLKYCKYNLEKVDVNCCKIFKFLTMLPNLEVTTYSKYTEHILYLSRSLQHNPLISSGHIKSGSWGNYPSGETFFIPNLKSINGEICVNGSLPEFVFKEGEYAIFKIKEGEIYEIEPSNLNIKQKLELLGFFNDFDLSVRLLSEVGIGANNQINSFTGSPLFDEKIIDTIHIGFGSNTQFGGDLSSPYHHDLVCHKLKVKLFDNKRIFSYDLLNNKLMLDNDINCSVEFNSNQIFLFNTEILVEIVNKNFTLEVLTNKGSEDINLHYLKKIYYDGINLISHEDLFNSLTKRNIYELILLNIIYLK